MIRALKGLGELALILLAFAVGQALGEQHAHDHCAAKLHGMAAPAGVVRELCP